MSTLVASTSAADESAVEMVPETLADLVRRLGDIPLERIRMRPAPGTAVEQDLSSMPLCELIDGVVVEKVMSFFESRLAMMLVVFLEAYLKEKQLGFVVGPDAQTRVAPGRIRIPDVAFFSWSKTKDGRVPMDPIGPYAPDLAVEILSPGNTRREMEQKRKDLFAAGTRLIWIVDVSKRSVAVYHSEDQFRMIEWEGSLDGEEVLPGFSLNIREWFERATGERRGPQASVE